MGASPPELVCHACDVVLTADNEDGLVDLAIKHSLSIHGHEPTSEYILARIHLHNR